MSVQEYAFENFVCNMLTIVFKPQSNIGIFNSLWPFLNSTVSLVRLERVKLTSGMEVHSSKWSKLMSGMKAHTTEDVKLTDNIRFAIFH